MRVMVGDTQEIRGRWAKIEIELDETDLARLYFEANPAAKGYPFDPTVLTAAQAFTALEAQAQALCLVQLAGKFQNELDEEAAANITDEVRTQLVKSKNALLPQKAAEEV